MANLTIKNLPDELYEKIKAIAAYNRRSINNEVIVIIENAIEKDPIIYDDAIERVRILREKMNIYVTEDEINQAKNEGRP
ncbi:MAG: Arc family DNA-binding protein [Chloroflexota bacterium]